MAVYHRSGRNACGRRIADKGEKFAKVPARVRSDRNMNAIWNLTLVSEKHRDHVCTCNIEDTPTFTSQPLPPDLQYYDKANR